VELFGAWTVNPLVPDLSRGAYRPRGYGPFDQISGPVLGGCQRLHASRDCGRVLLHFLW